MSTSGRSLSTLMCTVVLCVGPWWTAWVAGQEPLVIPRLNGPVELDGPSDEPAWQGIDPLPLTVYEPTYGGTPTEDSEIRVAYDDTYIYLAGRFYDSNPAGIRANSLYRDRFAGDDTFGVIFDTFNDNENAVWFFTTPMAVRADMTIANDAADGGFNNSWNTFWDAAAVRNEEGWFSEMRIPFSSLGFQDVDGRVVMGLSVYRWLSRKNERHIFPAVPPDWERAFSKPSELQDVVFEGIRRRKPVYITPYALGGFDQLAHLPDGAAAYDLETDRTNEVGLDVKYSVTSNLTFDGTINTDFAQVEADDQQINLTRFPLFFPEKRQFFQERSGVFQFDFSGESRLFHSRRIGLSDGEPVRILGGTRLVGRVGDWDVGFVDMQTARSEALPAENFGVVRLRRRLLNPYSTVGGIFTSRVGDDGRYDLTYGVDGLVRVFGDEYVTLKWAQTFQDDVATEGLAGGRVLARWERRKVQGLSYNASFGWSGPDYAPGIGFETREDFRFYEGNVDYQWFLGQASPLRRIWVGHWANAYTRNGDGSVESGYLHPFFWFETKTGFQILLSTEHNYESVGEPFAISEDVAVPEGHYWFHRAWLELAPPRGLLFRPTFTFRAGEFYDGWAVAASAGPAWNISPFLELSADYQINVIRFPNRGQSVDTHLGRLRVQTAFDIHASIATFIQYNSVADVLSVNARFRYQFSEGNDLWLVYNEGLNTERRQLAGPNLPLTNARAVMLKYTYTFVR